MTETFTRVAMGVVTGYELVDPVTDPETGELLAAKPVHTITFDDRDGYGGTMRLVLTMDRRFADRIVGKPVSLTLEMPR